MHLEWARPGVLSATAHAFEFAALVAAARFVAESAPPEIPTEALEQLRQILHDYDTQALRLREAASPADGA
ncbi:hypothetical protein J7E96_01415 [Streptomyces sp. ISL-96]|uniref:hypothetical protein n=1 Tax=unclassified Streptomyces TaxID=2593676 RepID=UPI001BE514C5|nr:MULTISPECIES: hypothetical protein [unclassified Streptomyces]MBT2401513.1 hypothetical protein [Streptomyces sp. ISL-100]MBT2487217.1 hypothetical protein [Streptomyces sp. ISL-96]MBT2510585.1 hypothetical protein [Streptomyces sp. ISL-98]